FGKEVVARIVPLFFKDKHDRLPIVDEYTAREGCVPLVQNLRSTQEPLHRFLHRTQRRASLHTDRGVSPNIEFLQPGRSFFAVEHEGYEKLWPLLLEVFSKTHFVVIEEAWIEPFSLSIYYAENLHLLANAQSDERHEGERHIDLTEVSKPMLTIDLCE